MAIQDLYHPQTILAYELNGAPLRLRFERPLGYKHAKYVMRSELAESLGGIGGGRGGYWEDPGYENGMPVSDSPVNEAVGRV